MVESAVSAAKTKGIDNISIRASNATKEQLKLHLSNLMVDPPFGFCVLYSSYSAYAEQNWDQTQRERIASLTLIVGHPPSAYRVP